MKNESGDLIHSETEKHFEFIMRRIIFMSTTSTNKQIKTSHGTSFHGGHIGRLKVHPWNYFRIFYSLKVKAFQDGIALYSKKILSCGFTSQRPLSPARLVKMFCRSSCFLTMNFPLMGTFSNGKGWSLNYIE